MTNDIGSVGPDRITGHTPVRNDPGCMDVHFEHREPIRIHISDWVNLNLKVGEVVNEDLLASVEATSVAVAAHRLAVRYLAARSRSKKEVRNYLLRKGVLPEVCDEVMVRLGQQTYLDDSRLANSYVEQARSKMSRREMTWKLRQRGVSQETVEQAITANTDSEEERHAAYALALRNCRRFGPNPAPEDWRKLAASLQRKGFSTSVIVTVIRDLRNEVERSNTSVDS